MFKFGNAEGGVQQQSVMAMSWREIPLAAMAACRTAASTLWWPDEIAGKASNYLRQGLFHLIFACAWRLSFPMHRTTQCPPSTFPMLNASNETQLTPDTHLMDS